MGALEQLAQSVWEGRTQTPAANDAHSSRTTPAALAEPWPPSSAHQAAGNAEDGQHAAWPQPEHHAADNEHEPISEACESDEELSLEAAAARDGCSKLAEAPAEPSCTIAEAVDAGCEECQLLQKRAASLCIRELLEYKRAKQLNALGGGAPAVAAAADSAQQRIDQALLRVAARREAGELTSPLPFALPSILRRQGSGEKPLPQQRSVSEQPPLPPTEPAAASEGERGMERNSSRVTLAGGEEVQLLIDSSALEVLTCLLPPPAKAHSGGKPARGNRAPSVLGSIDTNARPLPPWRE